jgi:protein-S-isoprenylcysteine O-methyltransferase Ste14
VSPIAAIWLCWGLWFAAWIVLAVLGKHEAGTLGGGLSFLYHLAVAVAGLFLLTVVRPFQAADLQYTLWTFGIPDALGWGLLPVALAGFGLAGWASAHRINRLKHGAAVVDSGPYAVVRHPIYLGLIIAAAITAILFGQLTSALGAVLLAGVMIGKVLFEERRASDAAHRDYRRRVPMFVPFWPTGG